MVKNKSAKIQEGRCEAEVGKCSAIVEFGRILSEMLRQISSLIPAVRSAIAGDAVGALALVRGFADDANLKKTVLYDLHVQNGGEVADAVDPRCCAFRLRES